jgi:hypothetical protein
MGSGPYIRALHSRVSIAELCHQPEFLWAAPGACDTEQKPPSCYGFGCRDQIPICHTSVSRRALRSVVPRNANGTFTLGLHHLQFETDF